jgi:general secretion pathway protein D
MAEPPAASHGAGISTVTGSTERRGCWCGLPALVGAAAIAATLAACAMPDKRPAPAEEPPSPPASTVPTTPAATDKDADRIRQPRMLRGTGAVIGPSRPIAKVEVAAGGQMTLNFVGADIRDVVRAILGDILKVNFIIDAQVQGTVTMSTSRPIDRSALLATLEEVLRVNNAVLVRTDDQLFRIVPAAEAARGGVPIQGGLTDQGFDQGYGIRVVPLQYVSAAEMEKVLEPIATKGAILRVDKVRNILMIAGTANELASISEAIDLFDVDWLKGMSFGILPLQFADAKTLVAELTKIFGGEGEGEAPISGFRLIPIERLNALMVITQRHEYLDEVRKWVERLDEAGDGTDRQVYVYFAQNAKAADLATVLSELFGGRGTARPPEEILAPSLRGVELRTQPRTTTGFGTGTGAGTTGAGGTGASATGATGPGGPTSAQRGISQPLQAGISRPASTASAAPVSVVTESGMRIIAHDTRNALVIYATRAEYLKVETTLRKLDILPLQVLIQATIAEVTLTDELRYGVQWFLDSGRRGTFTFSELATGAVQSVFSDPGGGFSYVFNRSSRNIVLNALSQITDVNVVSAPHVLVLDNQSASLQVGDQIPVSTRSSQSVTDPNAPIVNSVEYRDTGVILKVTPRINAGGLITLEIDQEVSDVSRISASDVTPTIQQRRFSSTVAVQTGESVVLGGLIRDRTDKGKSGVPLLSDIPVFGALFGSRATTDTRTELIVVLTPQVVRNQGEARAVTDEMRRRLRKAAPYTFNDGRAPTQPRAVPPRRPQ